MHGKLKDGLFQKERIKNPRLPGFFILNILTKN